MVAAGQVRRSEHAPSGGVISTASDLARWAHCLRSGIAVSKTSFGLLTTPGLNAVRKGHRWGGVSYGFGLQNVAGQHREISHGGYVPGYLSMLVSYPGISLDLIVLENVSRPLGPGGDTFNLHDRLRATVRAALVSGGHVPTALRVSRSGPVRTGKAMPRLPRGAGLNVCPRTVLLPDGEH